MPLQLQPIPELEPVFSAWRKNRFWDALVSAWDVRTVGLREDLAELGSDFLLRACSQAIKWNQNRKQSAKVPETLKKWLTSPFEPPNCLVICDSGDLPWAVEQREFMLRIHLECTRTLLEAGVWTASEKSVTTSELRQLAERLVADVRQLLPVGFSVPVGFIRDLLDRLIHDDSRQRVRQSVRVGVALVSKNAQDEPGMIARAKLELLAEGKGDVYPDPVMAFVSRGTTTTNGGDRDDFAEAERSAWREALVLLGLSPATSSSEWANHFDVRWQLFDPMTSSETPLLPPRLTGDSAGGAFALGIAQLLARELETALLTGVAHDPS